MKPVWKDSFYDTPGAGSNKTFMKADLTHSPNEKYWHLEVTCENGKIVQVQPYQIESIQITYEYNGTEKTITVPASDLVYYGHDVATYDIELNDPSFNIICFYNETDGLTGNIYQLYALRAVETNTALGTENMPPVPTYGDGSKYVFTNWEVNAWDGSGTTFDANDIVTEDINVYAKKLSTEGEGGIEIHVMNDNNALIERAVEIYNAENGDNLSVDQIDMDSIKIRVNGNQGTSTNEYYWENKWKDKYDWYWVANYNLSSLPGTTHNDRVPFAQIDNITIYFQANDGTVAGASTIEVGDTQEGIDYGELEKMQLGDERIIELRLKGPAVPPTEEELEGDSDNPGILGEDAVKVQCTTNEEEHEAITTGLLPDSYSVSEKATWKKINGEAAYYVDVTVEDDKYVENYNNSHKGHTLDGADSQTITLKWNGSAWTPVTDIPVTFNVKCESEEPTEPETPSDKIVKELLENAVTVECNNESATHDNRDGKTYGLIEDGYTLAEKVTGDADDGYTYTVTIQPDAYVSQYSTDTKVTHTQVSVVPENSTITLEWTGTEWQVAEDSTTVTITVHCDSEEPTTPEKPNEGVLNDLLDVELDCDSNVGHQDKVYENLLSDSYTLDEDVTQNADGTYTIGVTVNSAAYIANYDGQELDPAGKHEIKKGEASEKKVTLTYDNKAQAWTVDNADKLITFLIVCSGTGDYDINGFAKDLIAGNSEKEVAQSDGVEVENYTIPEENESVVIPYNGEVTLLYKLTVTGNGQEDVNFVVTDDGAEFVQAVRDAKIVFNAEEDTFTGIVPADESVSFYVSKTFDADDIINGKLVNEALIAGTGEDKDASVDPGIDDIEEEVGGEEGEPAGTVTITPADLTIYEGGEGGYDAVVNEDGNQVEAAESTSLPHPLFKITVPDGSSIDPETLTFTNGSNVWEVVHDGDNLYHFEVAGEGMTPVRVTYTNAAGKVVTSDEFTPEENSYAEYTIRLYPGNNADDFSNVTAIADDGARYAINAKNQTGKLTVRAVDGTQEESVSAIVTNENADSVEKVDAGEAVAVEPENGTTYSLNNTEVKVDENDSKPSLLFDTIIDDEVNRTEMLEDKVDEALGGADADRDYEIKYIDLVDANNGNAWIASENGTDILWGYPEGTDIDTEFQILHFKGLHRDGETTGFDPEELDAIDVNDESQLEHVTITNTDEGILFHVDKANFSPFALTWETDNGGSDTPGGDTPGGNDPWYPPYNPGDDDKPSGLNTEDHFSYVVGYEDGMVKPQRSITRAEVATIFYRLLEDDVRDDYDTTRNNFSDVTSDSWYNQTVSTLASMGILKGYEDGTFRPNASITRAEFAAIATRFFEETGATYEPGTFTDVTGSEWFAG
ncbi:MAG: S-layer homology domain-containing protein, partial [Peptococcaceae bacterium]|nr:S-layer homology domain-containing protein [Peptococcaceae bacterium]